MHDDVVLGVDIARSGSDRTVAMFRRPNESNFVRVSTDEMIATQQRHDAEKDNPNHHCWLCPFNGPVEVAEPLPYIMGNVPLAKDSIWWQRAVASMDHADAIADDDDT